MATLLTPIGCNYYVRTNSLTVDAYQKLVDRGWRRSGSLLYKPDVLRACCPHYTIRLPAASFRPSRDQRQALNRWNKYILGNEYITETSKRFPKTKDQKAAEKNSFDLVRTVHEAETENLKPVKPAHKFEVTLEPDDFTEEKFLLYQNYQVHVHHDTPEEATRNGFKRFLCSSPLKRRVKTENGKEQRLGSYHHCYRVDGRLIAMAVLDLLPHCVSGVYFVYHQDFEKWSFGKISAMREAALALEEGYEFYYMGFYIHNCVKMRYKGDYKPQYVLDPESYEWNPLDGELRELLDKEKYVSLSRVHRKTAKDESESKDVKSLEDEWQFLEPSEAADSGLSLIQIGMPGLMKLEDIALMDLGGIKLSLGRRGTVEMRDLVAWDESPEALLDPTSITGLVAEYAACIGPELAKEVALDFAR